jgi:capsid protein
MTIKITPLDRLRTQLREAYGDWWDLLVDPREPYGDDGEAWLPLAASSDTTGFTMFAPANEAQLADVRRQCRLLALENEFAINGHENRISYIVGPGHTYRATVRKGQSAPVELVADVQRAIDEFIELNCWHRRQQEIVRRRDRDGEAFLRFFPGRDGTLRVRFVEPDQIVTPPSQAVDPAARLGILTDRDDVETVRGYFLDGRLIDAAEIQHRKANVDANVRRGLPLFYPVRKNLRRAEKLLRNMSVVAEIQSAIALIRKHHQGTAAGVQQFVARQADGSPSNANASTPVRRYGPGTILDAHAGIEYDFPASGINASTYVIVLQAELRAIASRLVMPEFMLTSDASNANYASTMVAEGPAMRMFERLQAEQVRDDLQVMWRAVGAAIDGGLLPAETRRTIDIQAAPPSPCMRDQLKDAQRHKLEHAVGILSPQTWSQLAGLDYDQEQANFAAHDKVSLDTNPTRERGSSGADVALPIPSR